MKSIKWACILMMIVALAMGISACTSKEGGTPGAKAKKADRARPASEMAKPAEQPAGQPAEESTESAQGQLPAATSGEEQPQEEAKAPGEEQPQEEAKAPGEIVKPEVAEIMGTVLDSGGEIVVFTDKGNFAVTGEDLSDMVGKTVRVLGSVAEEDGRNVIKVISVYEVK